MTTYTYNAFAIDYAFDANDNAVNTDSRQSEVSFVTNDFITSFAYQLTDFLEPGDLPEIIVETGNGGLDGLYGLLIGDRVFNASTPGELEAQGLRSFSIGQVNWDGGETFVMRFDVGAENGGTEYFIVMGGAPLPFEGASGAAGVAAFESFVNQVDYVGPVLEDFGPLPGGDILLNTFGPGIVAVVTENDLIETLQGGFGGQIEAGVGNDTVLAQGQSEQIFGGAGNDSLDGGSSFFTVLYGEEGDDVLIAGPAANSLYGGPGNDRLEGATDANEFAVDYMEGGAGNDLILSPEIASNIYAGEGDDTILGGPVFDLISAGPGADLIVPGGDTGEESFDEVSLAAEAFGIAGPDASVDTVVVTLEQLSSISVNAAGSGDRVVVLDALAATDVFGIGAPEFSGEPWLIDIGNDGSVEATLTAFSPVDLPVTGEAVGPDLVLHFGTPAEANPEDWALDFLPQDIEGTDGGDTLVGGSEDDTISGGDGDDLLSGGDGSDSLEGGEGDDGLQGQEGDDLLDGGGGNDNLSGSVGNDSLLGGPGDDLMGGGLGDDAMDGSGGNDFMGGGQGNDTVDGNDGNDVVNGGPGDDLMIGGEGNDTMGASFGNDTVIGDGGNDDMGGGTGRDVIDGGGGDDSAGGGEGDDVIDGGAGNDFLAGGGRNDAINGGTGDDTINGGDGDDTMTGGEGADVFVWNFFKDGDADVITDFEDGIDSFRMVGVENAPGSGLAGKLAALGITDTAGGALIDYQGHTVLIEGVAASDLTLDDFTFL
ncbi:calcium-binding protein [Aestuariicoccus sp. MJ-SS9]|uniref:calcium-binding protein n=1 Tax=Aestuariicoccus sp. MJ-SS9 TaxID=3079855 RepID=UPI0029070F1E|nr:calcium-binding protein [Aestuariicoccus sp. MJ-SS9]MDU8912952.1 calcium-binding protein [Aestuariicoccus sp. MJ-SS9]